jgi:hypothetical protein
MEIKKNVWIDDDYHYYYIEPKYNNRIIHGLLNWYNSIFDKQIGYYYQDNKKGFWLNYKKYTLKIV